MADEEKKPSYGDPEYYNLNINWDIKDAPEVKAVINMLFEMKEKGNKFRIMNFLFDKSKC